MILMSFFGDFVVSAELIFNLISGYWFAFSVTVVWVFVCYFYLVFERVLLKLIFSSFGKGLVTCCVLPSISLFASNRDLIVCPSLKLIPAMRACNAKSSLTFPCVTSQYCHWCFDWLNLYKLRYLLAVIGWLSSSQRTCGTWDKFA